MQTFLYKILYRMTLFISNHNLHYSCTNFWDNSSKELKRYVKDFRVGIILGLDNYP
jgi:hypothetical protein